MIGTQLGFENMEEWMMYSLNKAVSDSDVTPQKNDCNDDLMNNVDPNTVESWYKLKRDGHPRYRYTPKYELIHEHDDELKKQLLMHHNIKQGHNLAKYLGIKIKHNVLHDVRQADGSTMAI